MQQLPLLNVQIIISLILLLPACGLGIAFIIRRPSYFEATGILLGVLLNIPYVLLINILALHQGWWRYMETANSYYAIPVALVLGWSIFWGGFLPYVLRKQSPAILLLVALMIDVWTMPLLAPLVVLGERWLWGEALMLLCCLLPAVLIYRFTASRRWVLARALLQSFIWGGWIIFLISSVALFVEGKNIIDFFMMTPIKKTVFLLGMAASISLGYWALLEFALVGKGTPIPFDPPRQLVTTGIYAYVANPLQISTQAMFICIAIAYESWLMLLPILTLLIYSEVFVRWHQSVDIAIRFGSAWLDYKKSVRNWIPRLTPYVARS